MGQGLFTNLGGLHFNLDHALPAGKGSRANNKYTRLPNCKGMRGTESKRKVMFISCWDGKKEGNIGRQLLLYICCSTVSGNPVQSNSIPTVVSTPKINLPATAETSLHS